MGAERADLEGLDRQLEIIDGAGGRGEMEHVVDAAGEVDVLGDVVVDEREVRVAGEVGDVVGVARDQVVDGDDAMAFGQQAVAKMRAEKAGAAGDDGNGSGWSNVMTLCDSQNSGRATKKRGSDLFRAEARQTTGTVRTRILKSSQSDQLSMYCKIEFHPLIEADPVAAADLPEAGQCRVSWTGGGGARDRTVGLRWDGQGEGRRGSCRRTSTFQSCGNSSMLVLRRNRPNGRDPRDLP